MEPDLAWAMEDLDDCFLPAGLFSDAAIPSSGLWPPLSVWNFRSGDLGWRAGRAPRQMAAA